MKIYTWSIRTSIQKHSVRETDRQSETHRERDRDFIQENLHMEHKNFHTKT